MVVEGDTRGGVIEGDTRWVSRVILEEVLSKVILEGVSRVILEGVLSKVILDGCRG